MGEISAQAQSDAVQGPQITKEERFQMFKDAKNQAPMDGPPKIQKVIFHLRDQQHFVKFYEPRVVSLGPIHHGKEKYRLAESFKLKLANLFVESSGKGIEEIFKAIEGKIKELRDCFEEEVNEKYKNDVDLAWILFVDGCAILQYIYSAVEEKFKDLKIKADSVAFCQQDLFLLENQVPYRLLEELMSLSQMKENLQKSIDEFIRRNKNMVLMHQQSSQLEQAGGSRESQKKFHLLDLLRTSLLGPEKVQSDNATKNGEIQSDQPTNQQTVTSNGETTNQPSNGTKTILPRWIKTILPRKKSSDWQSYRNVQELKAAGIHVKRSEGNSLRGISFTRKFFFLGFLWIPPLIVDDSTGPKLLNLIAYEMCLDFHNDFGITSYVAFLDSLIDEANDVKELRKAHVLCNLLGSDDEVAKLFNEIGTDLVPDLSEYKEVKDQIQKYYDNAGMTWMAEFIHNHFSSPWTVLAFLGALFALALSATQTWYAVDSPPGPCDKFCEKFDQNLRRG